MVLDLSDLSFMDSSGISALDGVIRDLEPRRWTLTVRPVFQESVRQMLELSLMYGELPLDAEAQ